MIYTVRHVTTIKYEAIVRLARFNLRLKPAAWPGQTLSDYKLRITPNPATQIEAAGPFIGTLTRVTIAEPLVELVIDSRFRVAVTATMPIFDALAPTVDEVRRAALDILSVSASSPSAYLFASRMTADDAAIASWAREIVRPERSILDAALELTKRIKAEFVYDPEATDSNTPAGTAFAQRRGVCQDFAHIMIIALRAIGLPAAYVSGYLRTLPPPGKPKLVGADATHAWVNLWCGPQLGWLGFDPTNGCRANSDHIFTAMGRDYADVAPVDGILVGGSGQHVRVAVDVTEVDKR